MAKNSKGKKIYSDNELEHLRNDEFLRFKENCNKLAELDTRNLSCLDRFNNSRLAICVDAAAKIGRYSHTVLYESSLTDEEIRYLKEPDHIKIYDFKSKLNDGHIKELLPVMNKLIFVESQTVESVCEWLACEHKEPVRVKKNYLLSYLMYLLAERGLICGNWQKVAEEMRVFANNELLTKTNLSKCLSEARKRRGSIINKEIFNAVEGLKR